MDPSVCVEVPGGDEDKSDSAGCARRNGVVAQHGLEIHVLADSDGHAPTEQAWGAAGLILPLEPRDEPALGISVYRLAGREDISDVGGAGTGLIETRYDRNAGG